LPNCRCSSAAIRSRRSAILHNLAKLKEFGVTTFQAEDEIAAIASAIGASYAGQLGVTSSSGPGIALKGEAMGLAIMTELPLVIVNSQRGGPSTGLPTKTEQSDLYQAVYGRNGDAPMPVIAARSPADAFDCAIEACRIAVEYMTPVMLLTDGYIGNAAEPWKVPDPASFTPFPAKFLEEKNGPDGELLPFARDEKGARPWIKPGTPGLMHRIGGIEKNPGTGNIDYSPASHQTMTDARKAKVDGIAHGIPQQDVTLGTEGGKLVVVGWGSTFGPIPGRAPRPRQGAGCLARPCPPCLAAADQSGRPAGQYENILVPEMNTGQFKTVLRDQFLLDAKPLNKTSGQPFTIAEIEAAIEGALA
jgi:2-oxoglutarate ferredoxin oxidoreductase subunit alpha